MVSKQVTLKSTVRIKKLTPALLHILNCLSKIQHYSIDIPELVITSINDSNHSTNSRHYKDEAVDLRVHYFKTKEEVDRFIDVLDYWLNKNPEASKANSFTILLENWGTPNQHIHIQVKKGKKYP